ncbi:MAG: co-chaperone GroES [Spirochaetales bacterium]|nr:co-chaperone GroES [Spirochaetales bacterium]
MKIKPLADRVLIKIEEAETKTASGLFIPQTAQEKTQQGIVITIGDDTEAITVKEGDKVMYDKYAGTPVKIAGVEHLIVQMQDIIAIIE